VRHGILTENAFVTVVRLLSRALTARRRRNLGSYDTDIEEGKENFEDQ
jgi:hypothetical protein